jgi:hypothetical protein
MKKNEILKEVDYRKTIFSPRWYMENMLYIVDKNHKLMKWRLNKEQRELLEHVEFCLENDIPIRMIILKARQVGTTTFSVGLGFWYAATHRNISYGIVAHMVKSAESIFQKCRVMYNNLPKEMQPMTTQMSSEGITFDRKDGKGINSKIQFATVNEGVYRGQTLSYLHLSECGFWEGDVRAVENSLAPTVSVNPGTIIIRESTANGYNKFKDDWDRAVSGRSEYTPFFFGWQDHEEYRMGVPKGFVLTDEEVALKQKFGLDDEQLVWRRYQINNNYDGNEMWFKQENPMTPIEAFVAAGAGVFDADTIIKGYEISKEPQKVVIQSVSMHEKLLVWEYPKVEVEKVYAQKTVWSDKEQRYNYENTDLLLEEITYKTPYTVGVDTSGMGANFNQVVVVNNVTKKVVARFGKKDLGEEMLAKVAVEIARMYNDALIAPEVNYSHEICNYIIKENYRNLYMTENLVRQDMALAGGVAYGWRTTVSTKAPMISALRTKLTNNPELIEDKEFWYEAEYYLMEDSKMTKMNAAQGHQDDIIIATAIAQYVSDSFQAKQSRIPVRQAKVKDGLLEKLFQKKKKTSLRKGVYTNHA